MSEPLTKDKRSCQGITKQGFVCCSDKDHNTIEYDHKSEFCYSEENLKSALEEFEKRINSRLDADSCLVIAKQELKKAFPAIYEVETNE